MPYVDAKDTGGAKDALSSTVSLVDKMANKGVIHRNNAANHKAKLWKQFNAAA